MADRSPLAVVIDLFTSPNQAFAAIKEQPSVWLPLVVLIVAYCAVSVVYMTSVDLGWFLDQQLQQNAEITEQQREQAVRATERFSPIALGAIGAVTSSIGVLLALFIVSLYYTGVSFVTHDGVKLKQWFAFSSWCTLPIVLGIIATLVNILVSDARFMAQDEINPLSFGNLLTLDRAEATAVQRWLLSVDVTTIWAIVLSVLGYQAWTKRSTIASAAIVLGPLACIVLVAVLLS
jgi:hypothetical protein